MHPTQKKLLNLIEEIDIGGMSLRSIADTIEIKNSANVKHHLEQLKIRGFIRNKNGKIMKVIAGVTEEPMVQVRVFGMKKS